VDFGGKKFYTRDKIRHSSGTRLSLNRYYYHIGCLEWNYLIAPALFVNESWIVPGVSGREDVFVVAVEIVLKTRRRSIAGKGFLTIIGTVLAWSSLNHAQRRAYESGSWPLRRYSPLPVRAEKATIDN
jgi:hypothetical protein